MEFIRIRAKQDRGWEEAWSLYQRAFPEHEKRTEERQLKAMQRDAFVCEGVWEAERFLGLLFFWRTGSWNFVEHFAVWEEMRGRNYGSCIMKAFQKREGQIILEIDPPENEIGIRRLGFYERLGFISLPEYAYYNPGFHQDPYPMLLMSYPKRMEAQEYAAFTNFMQQIS